jgi:hypothetical protein
MPTQLHKKIKGFALMLAMCLQLGQLAAQCTATGQVVNLSGSGGGCGLVILEFQSYGLLVPSDTSLGLAEGMQIQFSYEPSQLISTCTAGPIVDITCLEGLPVPMPECNAAFSYSATVGPNFNLIFQPAVLDNSMAYYWEFGDGETSTLPAPYHSFEQGVYEVCLTLNGSTCSQFKVCQIIDLQSCAASFTHAATADGTVVFENTSSGDYTQWQWETGDGTVLTNQALTLHDYGTVGIFTACLTVWNANGCYAKFCDYIFSGTGEVCDFTDCVLPGDTDKDGLASVYDLLPLGVGFGTEGPSRQGNASANMAWSPQFAPDWGISSPAGIDYKHLDCNGDGLINELDAEVVDLNYQEPSIYLQAMTDGAPHFWLDFDWDTVVINDNSPPFIELEADLVASNSQVPFDNLRGFALQLDYPAEYVAEDGIVADYNDNSFLGSPNNLFWLGKNRYDKGQYDLGFARKSGSGNGFGDVAKLQFIIIADVIGREAAATPFTVTLSNVVAVNPAGEMLALGPGQAQATVVILNKKTTPTAEKSLDGQVFVFPNPANGAFHVALAGMEGKKLEAFNQVGQKVHEQELGTAGAEIDAKHWPSGVYFLKIHTALGLVVKKAIVE